MARRDAYWWRFAVTAFCFAVFGLGGLALGLIVFPLVRLSPGGRMRRRARARRLIGFCMRSFIVVMNSLGGISYEFRGRERLGKPGQLIIANHPTLCDVIFLLGMSRNACCVVKHQLFSNWFTALAVSQAGYVKNAPTQSMVEDAATALASGQSMVIFPQGTRGRPGEPLHFHRGAASIAVRAAQFITPVFITCTPVVLTKGQAWYVIPLQRPHFVLEVGEDLPLAAYRESRPAPLAARALNERLLSIYEARFSGSTLH
jgi:1-acyl-sn-glycerol-3-phosphate acyltransferase